MFLRFFSRFSPALFSLFLLLTQIPALSSPATQNAVVEIALSGDTVRLKGGQVLRYIGVQCYSPESTHKQERDYANRAQSFNQSLVGGREVSVEWDSRIRDSQNRLLGYVYTKDGMLVNEAVLASGWGKSRIIAPNNRYAKRFRDAEWQAKKARAGIWEKEIKEASRLKRYIGEKNTKIYYRPDSTELERIPEAQLVYFDTRVDAKAAGYRACASCREDAGETGGQEE